MNQNQINEEAERQANELPIFNLGSLYKGSFITGFQHGVNYALSLNRWVDTRKEQPKFCEYVACYCSIYGLFFGTYEQILDTQYGQWRRGTELGILPPTHWQSIAPPPLN